MEKFADLVEERLMREIDVDAAAEEKEKLEYTRLTAKAETNEKECRQLDDKAMFLREEIKKWEQMEKNLDKEAIKTEKQKVTTAKAEEEDAKEESYMSPVMRETASWLERSDNIKRSALKAATKLVRR